MAAATVQVGDLLGLVGDWSFRRSVSGGSTMTGQATFFQASDHRLNYAETGTLTLADGKDYAFERRYIYELRGGGFRVLFDETPPRLFQDVVLRLAGEALIGSGFHNCAPDVYSSAYRFNLPVGFRIAHDVSGPRKAYAIVTDYARR
ncbi:MAG: hypothetical protein JWR51_2233 [Devosia sp.]|uniref:DUF6314 family protein n=1 Tax=Devosia sp. TaxID=1871048 RepID=UPI00261F8F77|nr:DUF6314 family protein [Devosia sp.]MDB5529130.1 hypothetical protein [Devosia sp.]